MKVSIHATQSLQIIQRRTFCDRRLSERSPIFMVIPCMSCARLQQACEMRPTNS